jgi:hypothetical protein
MATETRAPPAGKPARAFRGKAKSPIVTMELLAWIRRERE